MKGILEGKWGFDSNLIVYSLTENSPFYPKMSQFMKLCKKKDVQLYTSSQNILEAENVFISLYSMKLSKAAIAVMNFIDDFDILIINPLPVTIHEFHSYITSGKRSKVSDLFDLYLAITYLDNDINQLFTNNEKDFRNILDLHVANPFKLIF